jgi:dephospho-CoA kinase
VFIVGLTGGVASGKTTVSTLFEQLGIKVIDADEIARSLVSKGMPCLQEIQQVFGKEYLSADGELDRPLLRQLIFNDSNAKKKLESILHPKIRQQMHDQSKSVDSPYVIWSVPLLFESNMQTLVDRILVINSSRKNQIERLCARDNIDIVLATKMVDAQLSNEQRIQWADDIIDNQESKNSLALKVQNLHYHYLDLVISSK